jgi:hypothetical protein
MGAEIETKPQEGHAFGLRLICNDDYLKGNFHGYSFTSLQSLSGAA